MKKYSELIFVSAMGGVSLIGLLGFYFLPDFFGEFVLNWILSFLLALIVFKMLSNNFKYQEQYNVVIRDIRGDTFEIRPKICNIDENTKAMRAGIDEGIVPEMVALKESVRNLQSESSSTNKLIQELVDELNYQKSLRQDNSENIAVLELEDKNSALQQK